MTSKSTTLDRMNAWLAMMPPDDIDGRLQDLIRKQFEAIYSQWVPPQDEAIETSDLQLIDTETA